MPERRARLLVFHPALAPYRIDLFNALSERYELRLVFVDENVSYQSYDQRRLLGMLKAQYGFLSPGFRLAGRNIRVGLSAEIASFKPDLVVTHEFSPTTVSMVLRRWAGSRIPHVVWTADSPLVIQSESRLRALARRMVMPNIDGLIVYSDETLSHYVTSTGFRGPIGVSPNAQSEQEVVARLADAKVLARDLARQHGLVGRKVVLYVGRLARVKRVDRLIDAFAALHELVRDAVLVLVGDGPERAALQVRVKDRGIQDRTIFTGHREGAELYAWFNCGSIFVLTSEFEPWGAVVNEALIAGLPVVCTDRAGARALIRDGENGVIVDAASIDLLARALRTWLGRVIALNDCFPGIRPSLMTQTFDSVVSGYCSAIDAVLGEVG